MSLKVDDSESTSGSSAVGSSTAVGMDTDEGDDNPSAVQSASGDGSVEDGR